jgi:hypothetical protein
VNVDLVQAALFLAPGFLALKIFYLFGAQRPRSQWEWTTWSIVASLPLNGVAALTASALARPASQAAIPTVTSAPSAWQPDAASIALALVLAVLSGAVLALAWRTVRASDGKRATWLRRELTDSAWDQALEDAHFKERAIVVVMDDGARYRGKLKYGGREDTQAAGWMYLHWPGKRNEKTQEWGRLRGTHGLLIERSKIRLLQVYLTKTERLAEAADDANT